MYSQEIQKDILPRFLRYVKIDSQSAFGKEEIPSTAKQFDMARLLEKELLEMGMEEVILDKHCYVYATLPSNSQKKLPVIGFVAHVDTSPDFTGTAVKPIIWENYSGGDLHLGADIHLRTEEFPELKMYKGQTLITTDGSTLLGADDKAGVSEIMSAMQYLLNHPEIEHGKIKICFTPDEEVGRGADLFDVKNFGADWAYTMDGSMIGELEYENFNAAYAKVKIQGKIVHPGYAKDKLVNSMTAAAQFISSLPQKEVPEHTENYEGFYHLNAMEGRTEYTELEYIIRDHDRVKFEKRKEVFVGLVEKLRSNFKGSVELELFDQYYNMKEMVEPQMHIIELAKAAYDELNIEAHIIPIRGGTDGARLSYMGLPCPNIFAGGHNFHGRYEFVPLESMVKATEVIVKIAELAAR